MTVQKISAQSAGEPGNFNFNSTVPSDRLEAVSLASVNDNLLLLAGFDKFSPRYWTFDPLSAGPVSGSINLENVENVEQKTFIRTIAANDGSYVMMLTAEGEVQVWEKLDDSQAVNYESLGTFNIPDVEPEDDLPFITYFTNNSFLLGFGFNSSIYLWDTGNSEPVPILTGSEIKAMAISPSGSLILSLPENGNPEGWAVRGN